MRSVALATVALVVIGLLPGLIGATELELGTVSYQPVVSEYQADAVVEAVNRSSVSAQTSGRVSELLVDINDTVEKGEPRLGVSGRIARDFQVSEITPLLALVGVLMGVFAVLVTPREEEPQIEVTFANVFVPFPGATAEEVEQLVSTLAEQMLSEIEGLKQVYSVSRPGLSVLSVEYEVGEPRTEAIVRLYTQVFINQDWLPENLGVGQPIIKPKGIGAVCSKPIVLTGIAAMLGAFFILDDPIFRGLAVSLIFGILVSTVLTLVVIPVLYYASRWRRLEQSSVESGAVDAAGGVVARV